VLALNAEDAYLRSIDLANRVVARLGPQEERWIFRGIENLFMVYEKPADGSELLWSQMEATSTEIGRTCRKREDLRAFEEAPRSVHSGWYIGKVVLHEIHDDGSHGDHNLMWINSYLLKALDAQSAYDRALQIGYQQETEPASHLCNGEKAHWKFVGISDLILACEPPADGALLWFEESNSSLTQLDSIVPTKSELAVFKWEAEQRQECD